MTDITQTDRVITDPIRANPPHPRHPCAIYATGTSNLIESFSIF